MGTNKHKARVMRAFYCLRIGVHGQLAMRREYPVDARQGVVDASRSGFVLAVFAALRNAMRACENFKAALRQTSPRGLPARVG